MRSPTHHATDQPKALTLEVKADVFVGLCCRDDDGHLSTLTQVQIGDLLHLHGDLDDGEEITLAPDGGAIFVNQVHHPIHDHRLWLGNPYWDGAVMQLADAARLVNHMMELPHWQVIEGIAALYGPLQRRWRLRPEQLRRWL